LPSGVLPATGQHGHDQNGRVAIDQSAEDIVDGRPMS
jgi:hypothetical protein